MTPLISLFALALAAFASGSWHESLGPALAEAKAQKASVFVDFEAPWCYSCYYMQKKVLSQPKFAAASKGLVLAKLDVDKEEGHGLRSARAVTFLPTYLVLDGDGKELGRIIGEQTEDEFIAKLGAIRHRSKGEDDQERLKLREKASKGDAAAMEKLVELPATCETPYDFMKGEAAVRMVLPDRARRIREKQREKLEALAAKRVFVEEAKRCADFRSAVEALSEVYKRLGEDAKVEKLLDDAVARLEPSKAPGEDRNRDDNLRYFLEMKGDEAGARAWYEQLLTAYPADYVYPYRFARFLEARKKPEEALPWIEKADKLAYGANRLQVTLVRAKILSALGKKDEAEKLAKRDLKASGGKFPALEKPLSDWLAAQK